MNKMILNSALILSLPVFSVHAQNELSKEYLANECHQLSEIVNSLVPSQHNSTCVDKLYASSIQLNTAAEMILNDSNSVAKQILNNAVFDLQYAELNSCNRYIEISHSKFEAHKLKTRL